MEAWIRCADCGAIVRTYFDGREVRVSYHDVCGMGGQLLVVQERARKANEREKSEART